VSESIGEGSLAGRVILVPRPDRQGEPLAERLRALGARADLRPTIDFAPPTDPSPVRAALDRIGGYERIVFTSANGVRFFLEAYERVQGGSPLRSRLAAVGPATARALELHGYESDLIGAEGHAEGLARALVRDGVKGETILLVGPERGSDTLPDGLRAAGAIIDAVAFYRTVAAAGAAGVAADVASGSYDGVVFTSPSTLRCLLEAAGEGRERVVLALDRMARVAIGPVTASALEDAMIPAAAVAASPDLDGVVAAVVAAFSR
jgi:uroporphyrinogen-III synthase